MDSRYQALDSSLCQWNLDSGVQLLVGHPKFLELYPEFQCSGFRIAQWKISLDSTRKNFLYSRIWIPLHGANMHLNPNAQLNVGNGCILVSRTLGPASSTMIRKAQESRMFCTNPSTGYPGKFCVLVIVQVEAEMTFVSHFLVTFGFWPGFALGLLVTVWNNKVPLKWCISTRSHQVFVPETVYLCI